MEKKEIKNKRIITEDPVHEGSLEGGGSRRWEEFVK